MDIVFVIFVLFLKMVVNLCAGKAGVMDIVYFDIFFNF